MDASQYVDELINEYLLFRGFIKTFTNFNAEREARTSANSSSANAAAERQRGAGGAGGATAAGANANASTSSTALALNLPTDVDALVELLMGHVRACELDSLMEVWALMNSKFFVHLESGQARAVPQPALAAGSGGIAAAAPSLVSSSGSLGTGLGRANGVGGIAPLSQSLRSLEQSLKKALMVRAVQRGRMDKVTECLEKLAGEMTAPSINGASSFIGGGAIGIESDARNGGFIVSPSSAASVGSAAGGANGNGVGTVGGGNGWEGWFALPYIPAPESHPAFAVYFTKQHYNALVNSLRNLLQSVFRALPLPTLLAFNVEREKRRRTNAELRSLRAELERTKAERDTASTQLAKLTSQGYRVFQRGGNVPQTPATTAGLFSPQQNGSWADPAHPTSATTAAALLSPAALRPPSFAVTSAAALEDDSAHDDSQFLVGASSLLLGHAGPVLKARFNNEGNALVTAANNASGDEAQGDMLGRATSKLWNIEAMVEQSRKQHQRQMEEEEEHSEATRREQQVVSPTADEHEHETFIPQPSSHSSSHSRDLQREERERQRLERGDAPATPRAAAPRTANVAAPHAQRHIAASPLIRAQSTEPGPFQTPAASNVPARQFSTPAATLMRPPPNAAADLDDDDSLQAYCTIAHATPLASLCWSKSDSYLLTGSAQDGKVGVYNLSGASSLTAASRTNQARLLAEFISPDAMLGPSASSSSLLAPCPVVLDVVSSPGDRFLVASWATKMHCDFGSGAMPSEQRGALELWDLSSGKRDTVFHVGSTPAGGGECSQINTLALNHNANMLITGGADGMLRVFDCRTSQAMVGWSAHPLAQVSCIRLCADETTVLSAGLDGELIEWSLHRMGKVVRRIPMPPCMRRSIGSSGVVSSAEFLARPEMALDGETKLFVLAPGFGWNQETTAGAEAETASTDGYASYLYALGADAAAPPRPSQRLLGHAGPVLSVDWHPSSSMLVSASVDHTARLVTGAWRK